MKKLIDDERLIYKCCSLYYEDKLTQEEIAEYLKISRPTVTRMIKLGREIGIVKIKVLSPNNNEFMKLEYKIEKTFNLNEVLIVPSDDFNNSKIVSEHLSDKLFNYLLRTSVKNELIGVTMGMTLRNIVSVAENSSEYLPATFIPVVGGISESRLDIHSNYIASKFAEIFQTRCLQFFSPVVFSNASLLQEFLKEKQLKIVINKYKNLDKIIMGIGGDDNKKSTILEAGYITKSQFDKFVSEGAIGDIAMRFFDRDGNTEKFDLFNRRISGISVEDLKRVPIRIGIAIGKDKANSVLGAINGGFVNVLILDEMCANELMNLKGE